jgi:hypothetical protein
LSEDEIKCSRQTIEPEAVTALHSYTMTMNVRKLRPFG